MNRLHADDRAIRPTPAPSRSSWARKAAPWLLAACLAPLAACEPRFGEGNTKPRTPPSQPVPGSAPPAPAVPGQ